MNKVILCGRTCNEMKVNGNGEKNFITNSIAINNGKDKKADFINIIAFGKVAEVLYKYVKKGDMVLVEGSIHTNKTKDDKYYTSVLIHTCELLPNERKQKNGDFNEKEIQF